MDKAHILVIDDDRTVCQSIKLLLTKAGYRATTIFNPLNALEHIVAQQPDGILLDMNFTVDTSGKQGLEMLQKIRTAHPDLPIILITGWGSMELAVAGMKAGAKDFLTKPWNNDHLLSALASMLELHQPAGQKSQEATPPALDNIIGESAPMQQVKDLIRRVAPTDATVLVTGESGTGKELVAEAIHDLSKRKAEAFVKVNLGGLTSSLFESELFGHKKGAFTGAIDDRIGRFQRADGGTIFLDEVGDLAMDLQVKMLRVLQEKTFEPVGSSRPLKVNTRVISATHRPLEQLVNEGQFREDLYYRLNLLHIHLPALRERRADIPLLVRHFVDCMNDSQGQRHLYLEDEALDWLARQSYSGNIRQLKNIVDRTCLLAQSNTLRVKDFKPHFQQMGASGAVALPKVGSLTLDEVEKTMIQRALDYHNYNISLVAKSLGITRSSLYRRMEKYNLQRE